MTMLDDDHLAALLADAAVSFEVPATGPADIVARATGRLLPDGDAGAEAGPDADAAPHADATAAGADDPLFGRPAAARRVHRIAGLAARHRVLAVAACLVILLVAAAAIGALVRSPAPSTRSAAVARSAGGAAVAPTPASTTTTTPLFSAHGAAPPLAAAPFSGNAGSTSGTRSTTTPSTAPGLPQGAVGQPARIEQTGSLTLTVSRGKLDETVSRLAALADASGGFVANSQTQSGATGTGPPSGSVTLQVPVQDFATVLKRAQALGRTSDLTTKATDVSAQYVDLQSRITALQASRQQYLTILAKATTVGDVLAVQEQIDSIQSQIEQLQGQLQLLSSQTTYSTLTVTVDEGTPARPPGPLPESGLVRAWHASIGGFVTGVEGVIRLAGPLLFALLLLGVVLAGGRALWRRYQRHNL
jgi:hypothetical protein